MDIQNDGTTQSEAAALTQAGVDLAEGALAAATGGGGSAAISAATEAAAAAGPLIERITGLESTVATLQAQVAKYEAAHPVVLGVLGILGKLFPSEVEPLQRLIAGSAVLTPPAGPKS